jgi:hypothetical protein
MVFNAGDWSQRGVNTRSSQAVEIASANGVTNARGLSGHYEWLQTDGMAELGSAARQLRRSQAGADRRWTPRS